MHNKRLAAYILMLITSVIWGLAGPVIKFTLHEFPPLIFLTYRFGISAAIGFFLLSVNRHQKLPKTKTGWVHVFIYTFFIFILGLGFLFLGFDQTSALAGSLIASTGPLFVSVAGILLLKEHITKREKAGMGIAFTGTVITALFANGAGYHEGIFGSFVGNFFVLISRIFDAVGLTFTKKSLRDHVSPAVVTHLGFILGFFLFALICFLSYSPITIIETIQTASFSAHLGVWYMAVISGTIGYFLANTAFKTIEVSEASPFGYLGPLWALPVALLWLGESVTSGFVVGAIIIAIGVFIAEYKKRKNHKKNTKKKYKTKK